MWPCWILKNVTVLLHNWNIVAWPHFREFKWRNPGDQLHALKWTLLISKLFQSNSGWSSNKCKICFAKLWNTAPHRSPLFTKLSSQTGHESCNAVISDSYNCPIITLRHVYDNLIVARLGKRAITCRPMECGVQRTEKTGKNNNKKLKCNWKQKFAFTIAGGRPYTQLKLFTRSHN